VVVARWTVLLYTIDYNYGPRWRNPGFPGVGEQNAPLAEGLDERVKQSNAA